MDVSKLTYMRKVFKVVSNEPLHLNAYILHDISLSDYYQDQLFVNVRPAFDGLRILNPISFCQNFD